MVPDFESTPGSERRIWKCIGCGTEVLQDPKAQAEDERIKSGISKYERPAYQR
jgi:hypothetical protein